MNPGFSHTDLRSPHFHRKIWTQHGSLKREVQAEKWWSIFTDENVEGLSGFAILCSSKLEWAAFH
jgi:hypothetical protein